MRLLIRFSFQVLSQLSRIEFIQRAIDYFSKPKILLFWLFILIITIIIMQIFINSETQFCSFKYSLKDKLEVTEHSSSSIVHEQQQRNVTALSRAISKGAVLLRPALIGRLGNQMFSYSAAWGLSRQLQAAIGGNVSVRPVIWKEVELYQLFGDQLDAIVSDEKELERFKWEQFYESNALYDASLLDRMAARISEGRRGIFAINHYLQSWRYFHSVALDPIRLSKQFTFPPTILEDASKYISQIKQAVVDRYESIHQKYRNNTNDSSYTTVRLYFNQTKTLSIRSPNMRIQYIAVHMRLTDHHTAQKSRLPNREFFILAAAHFFDISYNVRKRVFVVSCHCMINLIRQLVPYFSRNSFIRNCGIADYFMFLKTFDLFKSLPRKS